MDRPGRPDGDDGADTPSLAGEVGDGDIGRPAETGLRGPNAEPGLRGPNAEPGLGGPNAGTGPPVDAGDGPPPRTGAPPARTDDPSSAPDRPPLISVGPTTGSALPHWTEPATGAVPVVEPAPAPPVAPTGDTPAPVTPVKPLPANGTRGSRAAADAAAGEVPPATEEPVAEPAESATAPEPAGANAARWRNTGEDWRDGEGSFADLADDDDIPLGALDQRTRLLDEQYLTFEDLDVPQADLPTVPPRGSAEDPILIQRTGGAAAHPAPDAGVATDADSVRVTPTGTPPGRAPAAHRGDPGDAADDGLVPVGAGDSGVDHDPEGDVAPAGPPPVPPGRDRSQAIKVGLSIAVAALGIFLIGALTPLRWVPLVLVVAAIIGAMIELFNAAVGAGYRPVNLVGVIAGAALPVTAYFAGSPTIPTGESGIVLVLFLSLVASMAWYLFGSGRGRPVPNIAVTMLGIVYIGVLGSFAALILRAGSWPGTVSDVDQGIPLVILVVIGTELYDAGGYLLGSRLGRTPLSAASPNKTREGLVLGMMCAVLAVVLLGGVLGIGVRSMGEALILAAVIAVVAPMGDLFESMLKRDLGVKDMSTLIPSHGGLLDRVDALLFTLPACYYTLRIMGLI
jgi:phosphatidate cytidylyltransferase